MIEVQIDSIRVSLTNQQRVVVLKEINADRYLPIWIGQFEAEAITIELQESEQKRPLTHDLLKSVIGALGGKVRHIYINDIRNAIFYARIVIDVNGQTIEVDSRPSDAIALAVRVKCGIFVSDAVMANSSVTPEEDVDLEEEEEASDERRVEKRPSAREDETIDESKLSAFADFLNSMEFDDEDEDT
ncbi:bifunctional nuclease family protein [Aggregatilineales bacterium SYSU G02658]